jgi:hypothetical protein
MTSKLWKKYIGKNICLIIEDSPFPKKREGIFLDEDDTHVFLQTEYKEEPVGFLKTSIKRLELIE